MLTRSIQHTSSNFEETQAFLAGKGLDSRLAGAYPSRAERDFSSSISALHGRGLYLAYMAYGADVEIDVPAERSDYGFSIPYDGKMASTVADTVWACTRQRTVLASPGAPQQMYLAGDAKRLALSVQQDLVRARLHVLTGEEIRGVIEFDPILDIANGAGRLIASNMEMIVAEEGRGRNVFADRLREAHFIETTLTTLLLYHPHSHHALLERPAASPASRDVKRVLDYLHEHLEDPVSLEDLVAIANVPGRTLNEHFRAFTGYAPMAYLRQARLQAARRLLMSEDADTVTGAAMRYGFFHLGRFANQYEKSFGEKPSDTLLRGAKVFSRGA